MSVDEITRRQKQHQTLPNESNPGTFPTLLTVREVARILRVDDSTVRRWVKQGALEAVFMPHGEGNLGYRIRQATVDTLLGKNLVLPEALS